MLRSDPTRAKRPTVSRHTLARQVHRILLDELRAGTLRPGQRLVESEIASRVGTSRGPVHEALGQLHRQGLVRLDPAGGASVVMPSPEEIQEIYSLRAVLEGYAAALIVQRRSSDEIKSLYEITTNMRASGGPHAQEERRQLDAEFHEVFMRLAGHEELRQVSERMRTKVALYMTSAQEVFRDGDYLARSHEGLIAALLTGDPAEAERRVRDQLIANAGQWVERTQHLLDGDTPEQVRAQVAARRAQPE